MLAVVILPYRKVQKVRFLRGRVTKGITVVICIGSSSCKNQQYQKILVHPYFHLNPSETLFAVIFCLYSEEVGENNHLYLENKSN